MKFLGTIILGLGSLIVGATKQVHEMLYQLAAKGGFSDVSNPIDDVDDPGDAMMPAQISWWVGGTTILVLLFCIVAGGAFSRGKGKLGALIAKLKKKRKR